MNTRVKYLITVLALLPLQFTVWAQSTYRIGGLPSVNVNKKLANDWSLNTKLESRQLFQRGEINGDSDSGYDYVLTDVSLLAAKKVALNSRLAGGYLMRFEDGALYHRFIQQYVIVQKFTNWRLAHRFSSDQTFSKVEEAEIRLRYRISSELPLNGESVDPREFYIKLNNEYVNSFQANEYDLEIRLVALLGYDITDNFKIETGLDYRVNSLFNTGTRHSYWMAVNLFLEI